MVLGFLGFGKLVLMVYCILEIKKFGLLLFFYFVGVGLGFINFVKFVEKLVKWLKNLSVLGLWICYLICF